jgi:hypothetical protein
VNTPLATVYFPVTLAVISKMQQPVARVMELAARWANKISAPVVAVLVVVLWNRECGATTAGDK